MGPALAATGRYHATVRLPHSWLGSFGARLSGGLSADFGRLWASSAASNLSDGIILVALPLIAVRLGASPGELAGVFVASQVPSLFLGLVAGGLADRLDRRRTMVAVQILRVAVVGALGLLAATGGLSLLALAAAAFVFGVGEAFFDTNAQSIVPMVAGRDRLVAANGRLFAVETVMNSFVGPPLGGVLIALSVPLALASTAAGFALAALGLLLLSGHYRPAGTGARRSLLGEIGEGIAYLARHPLLLTLTSMVALGRFGSAAWFALGALFAVAPGPMGLTEPQYGLLLTTFGIGSLVGSTVTGTIVARLGRPRTLLVATLVFGLGILVPALTAAVLPVALGSFAAGVAVMAWNITNVSLRQALLPLGLMGRVHATHRFAANVAGLAGAALAGVVGETIGLEAAFAAGAAFVLLGLLGGLVVTEGRIAAAEAEAAAA